MAIRMVTDFREPGSNPCPAKTLGTSRKLGERSCDAVQVIAVAKLLQIVNLDGASFGIV